MRNAEELVGKEAATINLLDRVMLRSGEPRLIELRPQLLAYVDAIVGEEFAAGQHGARSTQVDRHYQGCSTAARALDPKSLREQAIFSELLKYLDDVSDQREVRLAAAEIALPDLFWFTFMGMLVVLWLLGSFMSADWERTFTLGGIGAGIGLLLSLIIIIDAPFEGETSVSARAFKQVTLLMQARH